MLFWGLIALAIILLISIRYMPQLVRLRIRVLKFLKWTWAANLLERHFDMWVMLFRYLVFVIALTALYFAWASQSGA